MAWFWLFDLLSVVTVLFVIIVFVLSDGTTVDAIDIVREGMLAWLPLLGFEIGLIGESIDAGLVVLVVLITGAGRSPP